MEPEQNKPENHGYWDGDVFIFTPPIMVMSSNGPRLLGWIDLDHALLADLVTAEDVVHALTPPDRGT